MKLSHDLADAVARWLETRAVAHHGRGDLASSPAVQQREWHAAGVLREAADDLRKLIPRSKRESASGMCPYCGNPSNSADCQKSHP